jgi:hypothetical protein
VLTCERAATGLGPPHAVGYPPFATPFVTHAAWFVERFCTLCVLSFEMSALVSEWSPAGRLLRAPV